jgi:hypothetical protein
MRAGKGESALLKFEDLSSMFLCSLLAPLSAGSGEMKSPGNAGTWKAIRCG